jgi:hypothetical protein
VTAGRRPQFQAGCAPGIPIRLARAKLNLDIMSFPDGTACRYLLLPIGRSRLTAAAM